MAEIFRIKKCTLGKGLFATRDINKGEFILEFNGPIISAAGAKRKGMHEGDVLQIGFNKYIDCTKPCVYVNHSCSPNSGIKDDRKLFAIKKIKKAQQITIDYSTVMDEDDWEMDCRCGSKNCRKRIRDFKYLPKGLQRRYLKLGIVQSFISNKRYSQFK